jgi:predicted DNA-binding transcriptional regulator AlpA
MVQDHRMATRTIDGRTAADRDEAVRIVGLALSSLYRLEAKDPNFPARIPADLAGGGVWWWTEQLTEYAAARTAAKKSALTPVNRTGDADELVDAPEAARICGYKDSHALTGSGMWPALLERVDDLELTPGGLQRRSWKRSTIWEIADARPGRGGGGRKRGPRARTVDRGGDPAELVGGAEAARVLGYSSAAKLPADVLERADETTTGGTRIHRKWKRSTLWAIADSWDSAPS